MTEELNPLTLDLIDVLSTRAYPELEIDVYFNEELGFTIKQLTEMLRSLEILGKVEEAEKVHKELEDLVRKYPEEKYVIKLKGIEEKAYRDIITVVQKKFPDETDILGRSKPNPEGDAEFTRLLWTAYVRTVTSASGSSTSVGEKEVLSLLNQAPVEVHEQITEAIRELRTGAKAGFEYAAKEIDFLSQASPEG